MSNHEATATDGGSIALLVLAAAALLVGGCTLVINTGDGDVNVGDQKGSGTDINTDVGINA